MTSRTDWTQAYVLPKKSPDPPEQGEKYAVYREQGKKRADAVSHFAGIFEECLDLLETKSADYQNEKSSVRQADYFPRGLESIHDELHKKMLRLRSLLDARREGDTQPTHESLEDNAKDLINYAAIFVAYARGQVDGQERD